MYRFTQRLFPVPYEWARLARLLAVSIALVLIGEVLLPTSGAAGLAGRIVVWLAYPVTLLAAGFFSDEERRWLRRLRHPAGLVAEFTAASREAPAVDGAIPEAYEVARIDEDSTA
jgi:hypothetical protein